MMIFFPVIVLLFFLLFCQKMYPGLALLLGGALAFLLSGVEEPFHRMFFALGSVTDLLLRMALGALVVEFLRSRGLLYQSMSLIQTRIKSSYLRRLLLAVVLAFPGLLSGSFYMGHRVAKNLEWEEGRFHFFRGAILLGVLAPPFNPYLELLFLGRGWQIDFSWFPLSLILLTALLLLPFFFSLGSLGIPFVEKRSFFYHLHLWPVLAYLLLEAGALFGFLLEIPSSPVLLLFLFSFFALLNGRRLLEEMEQGLRSILPGLVYLQSAAFLISLAAVVGYRGEMVLQLAQYTAGERIGLLLSGSLLLGVISPQAAIVFLGVPAVVVAAPGGLVITGFLLPAVTSGVLFPRAGGVEGEEAAYFSWRFLVYGLLLIGAGISLALGFFPL